MKHSDKLTKNFQFRYVYRHGKTVKNEMFVITFCPSKQNLPKVGLCVSKKNGKATRRNRIKRLMRESMRALYPRLKHGYNMVVTASASYDFADFTYEKLRTALQDGLMRAGMLRL